MRQSACKPKKTGETVSPKVFGSRVKRLEDPALLTGKARFIDDIVFPGMLHAAFVRSHHGHAMIRAVDARAARSMDGVHAVYTLSDLMPILRAEVKSRNLNM